MIRRGQKTWTLSIAACAAALLSLALSVGWPRPRPSERQDYAAEVASALALWHTPLAPRPNASGYAPELAPGCVLQLDQRGAPTAQQPETADFDCLRQRDAVSDHLRRHVPQWPVVRAGTDLPPLDGLDRVLLWLAALLAGAAVPMLVAAVGQLERRHQQLFFSVVGAALLVRLCWPWRWTAVYFAYEWLDQARYLDSLPRYGPGAVTLWSWVLGPIAEDPKAVAALQALLGALGCGTWALTAARACGRWQAGAWAGAALALTPVMIRNDVSESMHVPALTAVGLSAWAAVEVAQRRSAMWAWLSAAALGLAVLCRADILPAALAALLAVLYCARPAVGPPQPRGQRLTASLVAAAGLAALVCSAVLLRAWLRARADADLGNLPQLGQLPAQWGARLGHDSILWRPDWWPLAAWAGLIAATLTLPPGRQPTWRWLALLAAAVLALVPTWLDFNETSLPRLQAPSAVLATVALAVLWDAAVAQRPGLRWPLVALWLGSAAWTLPTCLVQTNAHLEDALLREVVTGPRRAAPTWLAVRSYADEPAAGLHLHWPTWWMRAHNWVPVPVSAALRDLRAGVTPRGELFFFRSVRCHAAAGGADAQPPAARQEQADCAELAATYRAHAVWRREVRNLRDTPTFDWYGRAEQLSVGLYAAQTLAGTGPPDKGK